MHRVNLHRVFQDIVPSYECEAEECRHLKKYVEDYEIWGCTEREVEYDCRGDCFCCPIVDTKATEIEQFMQDNQEFFEYIEEVE